MADVAVAKKNPAGVLWWAPLGTPLPENAHDKLNEAFHSVGLLDEDGVTYGEDNDTTKVADMDGETALAINSSHEETIKFTMLETNEYSLKLRFGSENVIIDAAKESIHYSTTPPTGEKVALVADILMAGNDRRKRTVIEVASVTDTEERQEHAADAITYGVTCTAYRNSQNHFTENYIEPLKPKTQSGAVVAPGESH
ncbi:hypothetical protein EJ419_07330 [Alloscardovia theropitheci]|uniref:Phage tail protein n=1 Tax=Alloscardovia theropitheci TaxID=2496842 RepID=A0A4R0QW97_9BIFI|nr:hypothetical protein [Alloscardovia theropitheci]TCD53770.1 hypothetical protein EJ419_07330 [Alloscardovia theropitheci]